MGRNEFKKAMQDTLDGLAMERRGAFEDEILKGDNQTNYQNKAIELVTWYVKNLAGDDVTFETYVVWFCKTLQNWKALVSTTLPDGRYYEVTYDGDKNVYYLDPYGKLDNVVIPG